MAKPYSDKPSSDRPPSDKPSERRSNPPNSPSGKGKQSQPEGDDRRSFAVRISAGVIGALVAVAPLFAGLRMFIDPLTRRKKKSEGDDSMIRISSLAAMPEIGKVYRFPVITVREDKWNKYPPAPIGAVYLRRLAAGDDKKNFTAFTSVCPHLGCSVEFQEGQYKCPCHNSEWTITGERLNPESCPSPRDLDTLDIDVRNGEIFVAYQRFRGGIEDKVPE